jgi:hypothetical protein
MGYIAAAWGAGGVILLLAFAVARLAGPGVEIFSFQLTWVHWSVLVVNTILVAVFKVYRGFHGSLSPRMATRASFLRDQPNIRRTLLAPLFCMGYFQIARKKQVMTIMMTVVMVALIILVRQLEQPWRGIIDLSIALGLTGGLLSLLVHLARVFSSGQEALADNQQYLAQRELIVGD